MPIRLTIVGARRLFRECLVVALAADTRYDVVGHCDLSDAARELPSALARTVLVDLSRSREAALRVVRDLTRREVPLAVLAVGVQRVETDALLCMEAGARGYVPIGSTLSELHAAILQVDAGAVVFASEITIAMFERLAELAADHRRVQHQDHEPLTVRQTEILRLVARGLTNREIAQRLFLSMHTVKNHLHHVLHKLRVRNRNEAARLARRHGGLVGRPRA